MAQEAQVKSGISRRLAIIKGQVEGIERMLAEDADCIKTYNQISAVQAALEGVAKIVMKNHLETCVSEAIKKNDAGNLIHELVEEIYKFRK